MGKCILYLYKSIIKVLILTLICSELVNSQTPASFHYRNGLTYLENNNIVNAADEFEKAFKIIPSSEKIHNAIGVTLFIKSNPHDSKRIIDLFSTLENKQHSASSLYWLGKAYIHIDNDKAMELFNKAHELSSEYLLQDDIDNAIKELNKNGTSSWWQNLLVLTVILILSIGSLYVLRKWVLMPAKDPETEPGMFSGQNIFLFLMISLILIFSALVMGLINAEQFIELFNTIMNNLINSNK